MTSPLMDDPNARMAAALAAEPAGRLLAVYASVRSTARVPDALTGLGLPLVAYVLESLDARPTRVTATRGRHTADNPLLGLGTEVELWTLLIRCESEVTATVDVAMGPWSTAAGPVEVRVEWMRSERVTTFHPRGVGVLSGDPGDASLGLTGLEERLLDYAVDLCDRVADGEVPVEMDESMRIAKAARASVEHGTAVALAPSPRSPEQGGCG